jgi:F-type H+-transporting ATPase subunit delta
LIGTRVTYRYAKALFELAKEKQLLPEVGADMKLLGDIIESSKEFQSILESPIVSSAEKGKIISQLVETKINSLTLRFLKLLVNKKRENLLLLIIQRFRKLLDEDRGILRAELITTVPFSEEQINALGLQLKKLTPKELVFEQRIDKELLGGFVIKMDDTVIDNSLQNQLIKMREKMISQD